MRILIEGIGVLTAADENGYIKNADIGIVDDKIAFVSEAGRRPDDFLPDRTIKGKNMLAMPGLANAHTHCAMTLMRNAADDLPLHEWLFKRIFPIEDRLTDDDVYWGTQLAAAEMLKSGTTTIADMYLHMDAAACGIVDTGMKVNISKSPLEFHSEGGFRAEDVFEDCRRFFREWNGRSDGRIKVYIEVHSTYLFDIPSLRRASELAKELGTGIHIHLLETAKERKESFEQHKKSPVEICAETGIFDVPVIGAHLVHIAEEDISILRQHGVNAAHNPTSNLKLGSGISPVHRMLKAGVNVALGTDGTASNNNLNMFEEMHLAALIQKGIGQDPELVTARQAFMMATVNGSKAVGFGDTSGTLKAGMKADMILLDMDKPHLCPVNDPYSAIVYSAQGSDVDTVIVDGNILMEKRELKTIDEERVMHEVRKISEKLLK